MLHESTVAVINPDRVFVVHKPSNSYELVQPIGRPISLPQLDRFIYGQPPPVAGIDTAAYAAVNVRTPRNSTKAAWSSDTLRALQSNFATYDVEVAQLFAGLAVVMSSATRKDVRPDDLDFDVNLGAPIFNNKRQVSVTVRKPAACRVCITQTLEADGTMDWEAEVFDLYGISNGNYLDGNRVRITNPATQTGNPLKIKDSGGAAFAATSTRIGQGVEAARRPAPKKDSKRQRQVRI